ncbi:hypothetical protein PRABACTJOHN_00409 [Parabacteroides johnsonii DSM 18315]|uniref:Uncharacterized protein n=1 Tax=Parabacteroides johnsonii DSM 18315 TaxID=537006 RepID=B7B5W5_9BACT|nr:hypothetical protein PRABACTJOHN_00409 [Parabacteroides johnsonii DSM 18315]
MCKYTHLCKIKRGATVLSYKNTSATNKSYLFIAQFLNFNLFK